MGRVLRPAVRRRVLERDRRGDGGGPGLGLRTVVLPATAPWHTPAGVVRAGAAVADVDGRGRLAEGGPGRMPVLLYGTTPTPADLRSTLFDGTHMHGWRPPRDAVVAWSFYPTKTLGACGDAGAVTTDDPDVAARLRELACSDVRHARPGQVESWLDEPQAAVLRVKLRHLDAHVAARRPWPPSTAGGCRPRRPQSPGQTRARFTYSPCSPTGGTTSPPTSAPAGLGRRSTTRSRSTASGTRGGRQRPGRPPSGGAPGC